MLSKRMKVSGILGAVVLPLVLAVASCGTFAARAAAQDAAPAVAGAASASSEQAAANVTLRGMVRTVRGAVVPGATVRIRHVASGKGWGTLTDEDGQFTVPDVPAGQYHIEATQLGLGAAIWDSEVKAGSAPQMTMPESIDLVLRRKGSAEQPDTAEAKPAETADATPKQESVKADQADAGDSAAATKKHHKAAAAGDTSAAPAKSAESAAAPAASATPNPKHAKAATATASAQKSTKSKKGGFDQVEPDGILTANADTGQQSTSVPQNSTAGSGAYQPSPSSSSDAYLISGAVGRGSTAAGLDDGQDDLSVIDGTSGSSGSGATKKPKHQSSGSKHSKAGGAPGDNLAGGVADVTVRNTIKHLGSNQMHATLYDYYDNSVWDARPYAINGPAAEKVAHYSERFGANIGGPLTIPKIYNGTDRTFWFANYEMTRRTNAQDLFGNMPNDAERSGNFCGLLDANGNPLQIFDPLTNISGPRQLFPDLGNGAGCQIPSSRLDNAAKKLIGLFPQPNLTGLATANGATNIDNYHLLTTSPQSIDVGNFRVLHTISQKLSVSGVVNFVSARGQALTPFPSLYANTDTFDQNATFTFTQNWTPRLLNETRVNFNRSRLQSLSNNAYINNLAAAAGITGVSSAPIDFGSPELALTNFEPLADPSPSLVRNQTLRIMDDISVTLPHDTLRFGAEIRRRQLNPYTDPSSRGVFQFTGLMTGQLDASGNPIANLPGSDLADFLLGLPQQTTVQYGSANYGRQWQFDAYAQDDWRVSSRFSINYGVRYERYTPFSEKYNHLATVIVNPAITSAAVVQPGNKNPYTGNTLPNSLVYAKNDEFAPRIGIAWRPFSHGGPVIRAGYGVFYNGSILDQIFEEMINQPPTPGAVATTLNTSAAQLLTLENGFPAAPVQTSNGLVTNTIAVDPRYKIGYAQIWNLSLEHQFGNQYIMEILYTGTKGTHLDLVSDPNQPTPGSQIGSDQRRRIANAQDFTYETSGGDSIYNGLQVRVQRRMSNGLRMLFLYTLGHSIDDASVVGAGHISGLIQDYNNLAAERGNSFFDIRHDIRSTFGYDLPFGDRRHWLRSGTGAKLFGNWEVIGTTQYNTGSHLTPYISASFTNSVGPLLSQRPDRIGDPNLPSGQQTTTQFFNVKAFQLPATGTFGNAARGTIVGPSTFNVNLALERRMHFGPDGKYTFQLRWETQNLTNSPNFSNVITVVDAVDAGLLTGPKSMRSMDILMRVHF
ncbi:MAG: TonB-dependent receptor [Acidobacteriia bacterium]|nr:TonB-dependent receptor [Terriglobia bacterium]